MARVSIRFIKRLPAAFVLVAASGIGMLAAEPVAVRSTEGTVHGFLVLRTLDGKLLAEGDMRQTVKGDRVTAKIAFQFKDGSVHEQTTVYSQRGQFRVISDHLVQKGPAFPQPIDLSIDATSGQVSVRYQDERGEQKSQAAKMEIPNDLANGIIGKMLMNARRDAMPKSVSLIAATPTPRLVKLLISEAGREPFTIGGASHQATHYVLKVEIGGLAGLLAPLVGKQPPDSHIWVYRGEVPSFVRSEQPFYSGGPLWRIEQATAVWPKGAPRNEEPQRTAKAERR
jgi:hypothetical protein